MRHTDHAQDVVVLILVELIDFVRLFSLLCASL